MPNGLRSPWTYFLISVHTHNCESWRAHVRELFHISEHFLNNDNWNTLVPWSKILSLCNTSHNVGLFKHSQELTRGYLSHCTPSNLHSSIFGRFNAASSIGFILGPIVGGHLSQTASFSVAAFCTAGTFGLMLGGSGVMTIQVRVISIDLLVVSFLLHFSPLLSPEY